MKLRADALVIVLVLAFSAALLAAEARGAYKVFVMASWRLYRHSQ